MTFARCGSIQPSKISLAGGGLPNSPAMLRTSDAIASGSHSPRVDQPSRRCTSAMVSPGRAPSARSAR
ncbi:MAG: hypothetical protein J6V72_06175 [Kiritimatiellae bacterium]|nr:hypothetical protein [Kiritimatiellia bacterium]